jgi:hypothetical protein
MSDEIIIDQNADQPPAPSRTKPRRPNVAKIMAAALAPYSAADDLSEEAINRNSDLLVREGGQLKVLKHLPAEREKRFDLHCRAHEVLESFPPPRQMIEAYCSVKSAIATKPTSRECKFMAGLMLDGLGIRAGDEIDGYIQMLAYALSDNDLDRSQRWMPLSAIARAVKQVCTTYGETYGRPPPISTVLQRSIESLFELRVVKLKMESIGRTLADFSEIAKATEDSYDPVW